MNGSAPFAVPTYNEGRQPLPIAFWAKPEFSNWQKLFLGSVLDFADVPNMRREEGAHWCIAKECLGACLARAFVFVIGEAFWQWVFLNNHVALSLWLCAWCTCYTNTAVNSSRKSALLLLQVCWCQFKALTTQTSQWLSHSLIHQPFEHQISKGLHSP